MTGIYRRFYFSGIFLISLLFVNCLTIHLRDYQKNKSLYEFQRPAYDGIKILQKKSRPILELSYRIKQERKFRRYCSTPLEIKEYQSDEYSYDVQNRELDQECEFKTEDSLNVRFEDAKKKLFLYELGTAIHLNWNDISSIDLFLYRGQSIRKKISDVREVWTVNKNYFDRKLCIADSKNRIVSLDCSKPESDKKSDFVRHICIQAEIDCSKQPNISSLTVSEIPRTLPTYFSITPGKMHYNSPYFYHAYRKNFAVWLADPTGSQTTSQIVQIEFNPESITFNFRNVIVYGASCLLYPVTIAIDIVTAPFVLTALFLTFRD
ncbi:hypothetical protein [Leptospira interrogans]|uniref:hypothetical protein n=1 Tax=Leptospira interrogans TaxID=173 RepID=UPI0007739A2F|nr:hypothetical protein [Leptospira interrogans]